MEHWKRVFLQIQYTVWCRFWGPPKCIHTRGKTFHKSRSIYMRFRSGRIWGLNIINGAVVPWLTVCKRSSAWSSIHCAILVFQLHTGSTPHSLDRVWNGQACLVERPNLRGYWEMEVNVCSQAYMGSFKDNNQNKSRSSDKEMRLWRWDCGKTAHGQTGQQWLWPLSTSAVREVRC